MSAAVRACPICTEACQAHLRKLLDVKARTEAPAAAGNDDGGHIGAVVGLARMIGQGRQHCSPWQMGSATVNEGRSLLEPRGHVSTWKRKLVLHDRAGQMGSAPRQVSFPNQQSALDWSGGQAMIRTQVPHKRDWSKTPALHQTAGQVGSAER